jgi:hypothetical protein
MKMHVYNMSRPEGLWSGDLQILKLKHWIVSQYGTILQHATIEELLDPLFSMRSVSYQGKSAISSSQDFLLLLFPSFQKWCVFWSHDMHAGFQAFDVVKETFIRGVLWAIHVPVILKVTTICLNIIIVLRRYICLCYFIMFISLKPMSSYFIFHGFYWTWRFIALDTNLRNFNGVDSLTPHLFKTFFNIIPLSALVDKQGRDKYCDMKSDS